jgi:hypothetical protein
VTAIVNHHNDVRWKKAAPLEPGQLPVGGGLSLDDWIRAIVAGADDRSQRWKHLIVLGGLLIGIGSLEEQGMELYWVSSMRKLVEGALVRATNMALVEVRERNEVDGLGGQTITLALNHAFGCLADVERVQIDYDLLLPVLIGTAYYSSEGFQSAYFLGGLDLDVQVMQSGKLDWSVSCPMCVYNIGLRLINADPFQLLQAGRRYYEQAPGVFHGAPVKAHRSFCRECQESLDPPNYDG